MSATRLRLVSAVAAPTTDAAWMLLRFPPAGVPHVWIKYGPDGPDGPDRNWAGRDLAEHEHAAEAAGADCLGCGFPWWPGGAP